MGYPDLLAKTREFVNATQLMGALGAELRLRQTGQKGDSQVRDAMNAALKNLEPGLLDGLEPGQTATVIGHLTSALQDALEFLSEPNRAPGWGYTDPAILQERGRGSRSVARNFANLARQRPALDAALTDCDFLDVGTGVGWLAIEAAKQWPDMRIVGLDIWEPSLELAETNISSEGLQDRITLRRQSVSDIDDEAAFDVIWLPSSFLPRQVVNSALPCLNRALRPGGFLFFGGIPSRSDSLSQSLSDLEIIRRGGHPWRVEEITELLHGTGFNDIEIVEGGGGNNSHIIARR
jgi:2-polyprenyl-3-methyl-5-hydroxy-6-metoxy-1,4-benzoquinol methylase